MVIFHKVRTQPPAVQHVNAIIRKSNHTSHCARMRNSTCTERVKPRTASSSTITSQLDALLVLELPPRPIRGPKAELVAVQLNFDMWAVENSRRAMRVPFAFAALRS